MFKKLKILDEKNKILREISKEVTEPLTKEEKETINQIILNLKYSQIENLSKKFKDVYVLQPMTQRKQGKFVKLYFNQTVKKAVQDYLSEYPYDNIDEYLFTSRKGEKPIVVASLWRIISDTAKEAGIVQNIGSHSLRKSWGYWCWHNAKDKQKALVMLQCCFSHSSTQVTMKYIGLQDEEVADMYYSVELGLEYM